MCQSVHPNLHPGFGDLRCGQTGFGRAGRDQRRHEREGHKGSDNPAAPGLTRYREHQAVSSDDRGDENEAEDLFEAVSPAKARFRSEEHTSELQSLMRISYAVFCLKKKK